MFITCPSLLLPLSHPSIMLRLLQQSPYLHSYVFPIHLPLCLLFRTQIWLCTFQLLRPFSGSPLPARIRYAVLSSAFISPPVSNSAWAIKNCYDCFPLMGHPPCLLPPASVCLCGTYTMCCSISLHVFEFAGLVDIGKSVCHVAGRKLVASALSEQNLKSVWGNREETTGPWRLRPHSNGRQREELRRFRTGKRLGRFRKALRQMRD